MEGLVNGLRGLNMAESPLAVEDETPVAWSHAVLPSTKFLAESIGLPIGFLCRPMAQMPGGSPLLRRPLARCSRCDAVVSPLDNLTLGAGTWNCAICGQGNKEAALFSDSDASLYPELQFSAVEQVLDVTGDELAEVGGAALPVWQRQQPCIVIVLDEYMNPADATTLRTTILPILEALPPSVQIALVSYSAAVSVYELSAFASAGPTAHVIPGRIALSERHREFISEKISSLITVREYGRDAIADVLATFSRCKPPAGAAAASRRRTLPSALGVALQVGLAILEGASSGATAHPDSRILCLCSSAPTVGPGCITRTQYGQVNDADNADAAKFYKDMSKQAAKAGAAFDLFCVGYANYGLNILQHLIGTASGRISTYQNCDVELAADIARVIATPVGRQCQITVRCSDPVSVTRIVGMSTQLDERNSHRKCSFGPFTSSRVEVSDTVAVYLELLGDCAGPVRLQLEMCFVSPRLERVTRVFTVQLSVLPSTRKSELVEGVRTDVMSVLAARLTTLDAMQRGATDAAASLDDRLARMIRVCGDPASKDITFGLPRNLQAFMRSMYDFGRGPLMALILQHPDDILCRRLQFIRMPLVASVIVIAPCLYDVNFSGPEGPSLERLPLVDLAMSPSRVLLLDEYSCIFLWIGQQASASDEQIAAFTASLRAVAAARVPSAQFMSFSQNHSMSRFLACRLSPLHKNAPAVQRAEFPALAQFTDQQLLQASSKFSATDEPSYYDYTLRVSRGR